MDEEEPEKEKGKKPEKIPEKIPEKKPADVAGPVAGDEAGGEPDMIARANFAAERLEKANADLKKTLDRQEKMQADIIASGKGMAGQNPVAPAQPTDREYWNKVKKGEL